MEALEDSLDAQVTAAVDSAESTNTTLDFDQELKEGLVISFISHFSKDRIQGLTLIREWFRRRKFYVEAFEYKTLIKKEVRRPINPKNPEGPQEKVLVEEKIELNTDFKQLRQLRQRVLKEPQNVLMVQLERAKGEYCGLPLLFSSLIEDGRDIVVSRMPSIVKAQILAVPDLHFKKIPKEVEENEELKKQLLERATRSRGMQATMRELSNMPFFPEKNLYQISNFISGKTPKLTDAEAINLLLLSDLHNRYAAVLNAFEEDLQKQKASVPVLSNIFNSLLQNVSTEVVIQRLDPYIGGYDGVLKTKTQVFSYLYSILTADAEKRKKDWGEDLSTSDLFRRIRNVVIFNRSQVDPALWKKCEFIDINPENPEELGKGLKLLEKVEKNVIKRIKSHQAATSHNLDEIYSVQNLAQRVIGSPVFFKKSNFTLDEKKIIHRIHIPRYGLKYGESENAIQLFTNEKELKKPTNQLHHSIHMISMAYGVLIAEQLERRLNIFLKPGLKKLVNQYGGNFFDILYEFVVTESGFALTRNLFAKWLQELKKISSVKDRGYLENKIEEEKEDLSLNVLLKKGDSLLPQKYTQDDFEEEYIAAKRQFETFYLKLKNLIKGKEVGQKVAKILLILKEKGFFNIQSSDYRKVMHDSSLYNELKKAITETCSGMLDALEKAAIKQKLIIKIPLQFETLLWIGHTFEIPNANGKPYIIHFTAVPVKSHENLHGISKHFSEEFTRLLEQGGTSERRELIESQAILSEFLNLNLFYYTKLMFLDRLMHRFVFEEAHKKRLLPCYFRNFLHDRQKLIVGNTNNVNLSKIRTYDLGVNKPKLEELPSISISEILQNATLIYELSKKVNDLKESSLQLLQFAKKIEQQASAEMKDQTWQRYLKLIHGFSRCVALPLHSLDEKKLELLHTIATNLSKMVREALTGNDLLGKTIRLWQRKYPLQAKQIYFFQPFLSLQTSKIDPLLASIRQGYVQTQKIKNIKVMAFFPEGAKKFQMQHLINLKLMLPDLPYKAELFVETSSLSRDQVMELCKVYHPKNMFRLSRLDPLDKKQVQQGKKPAPLVPNQKKAE
ncbi:MAG: hypothetical protein ACI86H_001917 [bacterium]|jgi:hypothetical protein